MSFLCCHKLKPVCPKPGVRPDFYAQYRVFANTPSGEDLPFVRAFGKGEEIRLADSTTILLEPGYLYLIDFLFLATPEADSYMQIVPLIGGTLRGLYSFYAPTGVTGNASASGSFTTNEADEADITLSFRLTYPETVRNIDLSGSVSITPLMPL